MAPTSLRLLSNAPEVESSIVGTGPYGVAFTTKDGHWGVMASGFKNIDDAEAILTEFQAFEESPYAAHPVKGKRTNAKFTVFTMKEEKVV